MSLRKPTTTDRASRERLRDLTARVRRVEQDVILLRLNQIGPRELRALVGVPPDDSTGELEARLIAMLDVLWERLPLDTDGDGFLARLYCELREALATRALRVEVPEGSFDQKLAQATELVPAATEDENLSIAAVRKPALVRESPRGAAVVRPAAVVVRDCRLAQPEPLPGDPAP